MIHVTHSWGPPTPINSRQRERQKSARKSVAMDITGRLERVEQEIRQVEDEKLQWEQMLGAFWEHMPAVDPILIRDRMLSIKNERSSLENRKRALLEERQELIVRAVTLGDRGN